MPLPYRTQAMQSPIIPIVAELIQRHPGTISLGQGVVHYGPPPEVADALRRMLEDPQNHKYKPVIGIPPLLDLLRQKLEAENRIVIDHANALVVTAGGNMAFTNAVLAITDPGDEIILQTPYYFNHEMAVAMAGCRAVCASTDENYQLRLDAIREAITDRTRAIVTVSPNNPTGAVYPEEALREVNALCRDRGLYHIHDEAYEYFTYGDARHFSPASILDSAEHTISLFSLSKAYGFASWRIGYMTLPQSLLFSVQKIQDTILICPPVVSQYAAMGALERGSSYCRDYIHELAEVRCLVLEALQPLRAFCDIPPADGAFYFFLRVHTPLDSMQVVEHLVREHGVAVIPGGTFGADAGCYLRVAYGALEKATVAEGINRLVRGLQAIAGGEG